MTLWYYSVNLSGNFMADLKTPALSVDGGFPGDAPKDRPALAATLMVGALALLGFQDSLIKLASSEVSLWQFQLLRSSCNLGLILLLSRYYRGGFYPYPKRFWAVVLRSMFLVAAMIFFFGAVPFLTLSQIAAGLYVFPIFVAVLSTLVLGEKVGPRRVMAIMAGFLGTILILKPGTSDFQLHALMPVAAGLCYAATILTTRKLCREEHPVALALGASVAFIIVGALGIAITTIASPEEFAVRWPYLFSGWHPLGIFVAGIIIACSCLNLTANIGLSKAYQSAESSWLAPFDYSYLVFATFWGVIMWGDVPDFLSFAGMSIIAGAGCYVAWRERQEKNLQQVEMNRVLR
jgi:drug/metabolite transporter (DMT)-like permease